MQKVPYVHSNMYMYVLHYVEGRAGPQRTARTHEGHKRTSATPSTTKPATATMRGRCFLLTATGGSLLMVLPDTVLAFVSSAPPLAAARTAAKPQEPVTCRLSSASTQLFQDASPPARTKRKKNNSQNDNSKEISWLKWMDARLEETPIGELSSKVMKQILPIMNIYAKQRSTKGAENAKRLLDRIFDETEGGNEDAKRMLSTKLCNTALSAWAKSGDVRANAEATKLLIWMSKTSREESHSQIKPNTRSFSTVIDCWARSGFKDAADKAEAILALMEKEGSDALPNTVSFNSVINAHSKSNAMDKAVRAEALVNRMEELYKGGNLDVKPDVWTYQSLLSTWSTSKVYGAPQRCEEILKMMDVKYKAGDADLKPNGHCFTATINAWSKSLEKDKARSVYRILQHMNKLYVEGNIDAKPNVQSYTAALNGCAHPEAGENEAEFRQYFDIATLILEELRMSGFGQPTYLTYATFLQVCANCLPDGDEKDRVVRRTLDECKRDGQIGDAVLQRLMAHFPALYNELLAEHIRKYGTDGPVQSKHLPKEWRRNVSGERKTPATKRDQNAKIKKMYISKLKAIGRSRGARGFYSKEMVSRNTNNNHQRPRSDEATTDWYEGEVIIKE